MFTHRLSGQFPIMLILDLCQERFADPRLQLADIGDLTLIRLLSAEVLLEEITCRCGAPSAASPLLAAMHTNESALGHQPTDPFRAAMTSRSRNRAATRSARGRSWETRSSPLRGPHPQLMVRKRPAGPLASSPSERPQRAYTGASRGRTRNAALRI